MADRHTAAFWAAGTASIAVGGIFMTVTGLEPARTPSAVWANSWFDLGFAFVILGLIVTAIGIAAHFRREVQPGGTPPAAGAGGGAPVVPPPAADLGEFRPHHHESGEFPDGKFLTFGFDYPADHPGADTAPNPRRCTVIAPTGAAAGVTKLGRYFRYPQEFGNAPPVRPGSYRFRIEGQLPDGTWVDIASGEHEVRGPHLMVSILPDSGFEIFGRTVFIAALHVRVENTAPGTPVQVAGIARIVDEDLPWDSDLADSEKASVRDEISRRAGTPQYKPDLPASAHLTPDQTIGGWLVFPVSRPAAGGTPGIMVIVKDDLGNQYRASLPARDP